MANYDLSKLDPRTFQQLAQALACDVLGAAVVVYGDGPDGGRDASFHGMTNYPNDAKGWNGTIYIQAKCIQPTGNAQKDAASLCAQFDSDLARFGRKKGQRTPPDYYLLITNLALTPLPQRGTDAKVRARLKKHAERLKTKGWDLWDANKLFRLLDANRDIAITYGGYITPGDVLARMQQMLSLHETHFGEVIARFLQSELVGPDQYARLAEAGSAAQHAPPIADVFVDIPVTVSKSIHPPTEDTDEEGNLKPGFLVDLLRIGGLRHDRQSELMRLESRPPVEHDLISDIGRLVLIGGPGQGKSTLCQYLCQIYRVAILKDYPEHHLSSEAQAAIDTTVRACHNDGIPIPTARRFPVRFELKKFADYLSKNDNGSVLSYITERLSARSGYSVSTRDVQTWLSKYPWLVIFDGLDEVPATGNRDHVVDAIRVFAAHCASSVADVMVLATSRPQGYTEEFDSNHYQHCYLSPLSKERALHYAQRLVELSYPNDDDAQRDIMARLQRASTQHTTERLMRSPLQVTILAVLAALGGDLPEDRWQLFSDYYETICKREKQRDLAVSLVLREYGRSIDRIHRRVGLRLQMDCEIAGSNDALLTRERLSEIVLREMGNRTSVKDAVDANAKRIIEAALNRLVFLVAPEPERIGFEIRSLQEFMAAEALMDGDDQQIQMRFEAIARIPFWRNVCLFAAGHIAARRQYLIPYIANLCHTMNDVADPPASLTRSGSDLAIDLLADNTFGEFPVQARALLDIALRALDVASPDLHERLAQVCRNMVAADEVISEALERRVSVRTEETSMGAWRVLLYLIAAGKDWARAIAERHWPKEVEDRIFVIQSCSGDYSEWWSDKVLDMVTMLPMPIWLEYRVLDDIVEHGRAPEWVNAIHASSNGANYRRIVLHGEHEDVCTIAFGIMSAKIERAQHALAEIRNGSAFVRLCAASARMVRHPDVKSAREVLEICSSSNESLNESWINGVTPWPAAVLRGRALSDGMNDDQLAGWCRDSDIWEELEERWARDGVQADDLVNPDVNLSSIARSWQWLFPTVDVKRECYLKIRPIVEDFATQLRSELDAVRRRVIARIIVLLIMETEMGGEQAVATLKPINPRDFKNWIDASGYEYCPLVILGMMESAFDETNIEVLDSIGRNRYLFYRHGGAKGQVESWSETLCDLFNRHQNKIGLLQWLRRLPTNSGLDRLRMNMDQIMRSGHSSIIKDAVALRMRQSDVSVTEASELAERLCALAKNTSGEWSGIELSGLDNTSQVGEFLSVILRAQSVPEGMRADVFDRLSDWLASRKSSLHDKEVARRFGLE